MGAKLPALSNPGTAGDLITGKQLIDQNGNVLTGTLAAGGNQPVGWYAWPTSATSTQLTYAANPQLLKSGMLFFQAAIADLGVPSTKPSTAAGYSIVTGQKYLYYALAYHREFQGESQWGFQWAYSLEYDSSGNLKIAECQKGYPGASSDDLYFSISPQGALTLKANNGLQFMMKTSGSQLGAVGFHYDYIPT